MYLFAKALSQPALPEGNGEAGTVEDPQRAGDPQHMPPRLRVVTVAQREASRAIFFALLRDLHAGFAQNVIPQVVDPASNHSCLLIKHHCDCY